MQVKDKSVKVVPKFQKKANTTLFIIFRDVTQIQRAVMQQPKELLLPMSLLPAFHILLMQLALVKAKPNTELSLSRSVDEVFWRRDSC